MLQNLRITTLIIYLILFNYTSLFASNEIQLINVKHHISNWVSIEWDKTLEFQKKEFNEMKIKSKNSKKEISKFFNFFR